MAVSQPDAPTGLAPVGRGLAATATSHLSPFPPLHKWRGGWGLRGRRSSCQSIAPPTQGRWGRAPRCAGVLVAVLGCVALAAWAEDQGGGKLRLLKPPKGVTLNAEQKALLDQANEFVAKGYDLLVNKHDPGQAVAELRKALAIQTRIAELKPEKLPAGKGFSSPLPGTPADKIDFEGGIETILEIAESGGMSAPPDVDSGLYKRKIIKSAEEEARKLQAQQQQLTQDLQASAGGGGGGDPQQRQAPQAQQAAGEPGKQQAGGEPGKQQAGGEPGKEKSGGEPGKQQAGGEPGKGQEKAGGEPGKQQGGGEPGKGQENAGGEPGKQDGGGVPGKGQENAGGEPGKQETGGGPQTAALAARQEDVGRGLDRIATQLNQGTAAGDELNRASQGFRRAAGEAARTAQQIRQGDTRGAALSSRQVERAIHAALAEAGMAGQATLEEALAAVEAQTSRLQGRQQGIRDQTQQIGEGAGRGPVSDRTRRERARALAGEQAKVKPQIDNLQNAIEELAGATGSPNPTARSAENAAREEIAGAATGLRNSRPNQAVVNAAVSLAQGDTPAATKAMAQVQDSLAAVRERLAAADAALAGDAARLTRALRGVRQLAGEARRVEQTAMAAAGQGEQGTEAGKEQKGGHPGKGKATGEPGKKEAGGTPGKQETSGQPGKGKEGGQPGKGTGEGQAGAAQGPTSPDPQAQVSASWGQVLNKSTQQLQEEVARAVERLRLPSIVPEPSKQLLKAARQNPAFERDFAGSLSKVQSLLAALEKVEMELQRKAGKEAESKALRNYSKERIPSSYRKAVAEYYEELSKGND